MGLAAMPPTFFLKSTSEPARRIIFNFQFARLCVVNNGFLFVVYHSPSQKLMLHYVAVLHVPN